MSADLWKYEMRMTIRGHKVFDCRMINGFHLPEPNAQANGNRLVGHQISLVTLLAALLKYRVLAPSTSR
jgi:hypothetical protein